MDTEVSRTLAELERKLQELELALSSASTQSGQPSQSEGPGAASAAHAPEPPAGSAQPHTQSGGARLVDEGVSSAAATSTPASPTPPAEAFPAPADVSDDSIELAELSRFRDRLEHMTRELLSDYERVIRLRRASPPRPPLDQG